MTAEHVACSLEEYHARPEWSSSQVRYLPDEPEKFFGYFISHEFAWEPTDEADKGSAVHAVLSGEAEPFIEIPAIVLTSNAQRRGKAWEAFELEHPGKTLLLPKHAAEVRRMVRSIMEEPMARRLIEAPGEVEHSILFRDEATGLPLRMRADKAAHLGDGVVLVDFKSTAEPAAEKFMWKIQSLRYHRQAAWYWEGWTQLTGDPPEAFEFVAVRNEPPFDVHCYELAERALMAGAMENRNALDDLNIRLRDHAWHGPGWGRSREIDLPANYYKKF